MKKLVVVVAVLLVVAGIAVGLVKLMDMRDHRVITRAQRCVDAGGVPVRPNISSEVRCMFPRAPGEPAQATDSP